MSLKTNRQTNKNNVNIRQRQSDWLLRTANDETGVDMLFFCRADGAVRKNSIFQASPHYLSRFTVFLPFLWQESPRSSLVSTSRLKDGKVTFAHILWRSVEARQQGVYTGATSDQFWINAFFVLIHANLLHWRQKKHTLPPYSLSS